jgi:hypothetical protein
MIFGIVGVMKVDMILKQPAAHWMVAKFVMQQRLRKRNDQMCGDGSQEI